MSKAVFAWQYKLLIPPSLDSNGTRQQKGESLSSKFQTLGRQKLNTQGEGNTLQGGTYFQGDIAERVSDHVLLNSKSLQDGTNLEEAQQKRSQTELSSYKTINVDFVPPIIQELPSFHSQCTTLVANSMT
ncbi:MAG: hypothetical protein EZS28_008701 [Streblomastix strix]|uniref:Uncharacterized protein n=1 Tax=Streblomastix strix TaxID=222440 RepID=A0A5J4WNJ7_9EUKA|nr:MAG: hypothetical protein EZS28_008701 [Streblomastix strix]